MPTAESYLLQIQKYEVPPAGAATAATPPANASNSDSTPATPTTPTTPVRMTPAGVRQVTPLTTVAGRPGGTNLVRVRAPAGGQTIRVLGPSGVRPSAPNPQMSGIQALAAAAAVTQRLPSPTTGVQGELQLHQVCL